MQIVRNAQPPFLEEKNGGSEARLEYLKREFFAFIGDAEPHDDITVVEWVLINLCMLVMRVVQSLRLNHSGARNLFSTHSVVQP